MEKINLGDEVRLKSGSTKMIAVAISDCGKYTTVKYLSDDGYTTEEIMKTDLFKSCEVYKDEAFKVGDVVKSRLEKMTMVVSEIVTDNLIRCEMYCDGAICHGYKAKYELMLCEPF